MALAISSLTAGINTTDNPASTDPVDPTDGSVTYLCVGYAVAGGGTTTVTDTMVPAGARGTWTEMAHFSGTDDGSSRRGHFVFRGTDSVANQAITLTATTGSGTWTETAWSVIEVTGQDATPDDAAVKAWGGSGTTATVGDVGTPDAGDAVLMCVCHETDEAVSAGSGQSALGAVTGGSDIRTLHTFYDDSTPDETPNATWASSSSWAATGWIVNVGAGGGGGLDIPIAMYHYQRMQR